jgi:hypothetical protein
MMIVDALGTIYVVGFHKNYFKKFAVVMPTSSTDLVGI